MNAATKIEATNLASAMALAFAEIEGATKDKLNPHFKSKYADLGSVIDAIKPALAKHGLFFTQACHVAEDGVCVETLIHHANGDTVSCGKLYVPANKRDAQGFGSALTYARRYGLMTAFGVPAEDDDGNAAVKSAPAREKVPGIAKIKTRLNDLMRVGNLAVSLDAFNALVSANAADLTAIKEANHEYWTGDGEDSEGFKSWIKRRREELAPNVPSLSFQMLASCLEECETSTELQSLTAKHGDAIDALDDAERRQFEAAYDAREAGIIANNTRTPVDAG